MEKAIITLFFAYLALFPFGQLTRLPISNFLGPEVRLYLTDVLAGILGFWGFLGYWLRRKKTTRPPLTKPIVIFIGIAIVSLLVNAHRIEVREMLVASFYLLRWAAYAGIYFGIAGGFGKIGPSASPGTGRYLASLRVKEIGSSFLKKSLIVLGTAVAVFGLAQYWLWPNLKALEVLEWDPHFYRVVGTFLDPGFTGLILVFTLILIVSYWGELGRPFDFARHRPVPGFAQDKLGALGAGVVTYLALALTYSRASYLAYMVAMVVIAWLKKQPKFLLTVVLLGIATLIIIPQPQGEGGKLGRQYSIEARIENWENSLIIARGHPLTGVGFNAYRYAQRDYGFIGENKWQTTHSGAGADSSLLFVLATTGIFGFVAYFWLLSSVFKLGWQNRQKNEGIVLVSSLGAVLIHSFFLNSLFYPWVMAWLWILAVAEAQGE